MTTVLLADDDPDLRVTTRLVLERRGYHVIVAADGAEAWALTKTHDVDLLLLDVMMPGLDGISLTRKLRAGEGPDSRLPIIMLTARDLPYDTVTGLGAGADDYITKPFDSDVLDARIQAVLRRYSSPTQHIEYGDLAVDIEGMTVTKAGEPVTLSTTEFRLLQALMDRPGAVLSRIQLLERVWGSQDWGDERVVDVNVQRLRAKIGTDMIQTVRGAGYKWVRS